MKYFMVVVVAAALTFSHLSADQNKSGVELVAGFGKYLYDDSRLDDAGMAVFGISYRFDNNFQFELIRGNPDTTLKSNNADIDVDWSVARILYHFKGKEGISPYLSVGLDNSDVFQGENQVLIGLGAKIDIGNRWFWRLESNYHAKTSDISILAMIGYSFGQSDYSLPTKPLRVIEPKPLEEVKSDVDSDNDGVFDQQDQCPNTPTNAWVDAKGCQKELFKEISVTLQINFDSDKAVVKPQYLSEIERVSKFMTQYAGTSVVIEGHTDSRGKTAHNQNLSSRRAAAVAKVLIEQLGIKGSRVEARGLGEENPIADNDTAEGRALNRRVVAIIKQQVKVKQWKL